MDSTADTIRHVATEKTYEKINFNRKKVKNLHPRQEFYVKGHRVISFKKSPTQKKFVKLAQDIHNWKVKAPFVLEKKTKFPAYDLKPNPFEYNSAFMDILFDQNIPQLLYTLTGEKLFLQSIKVRISLPGESSYLKGHRDTMFNGDKITGLCPPLINIAYYPNFDHEDKVELNLWETTHLSIPRWRILDHFFKLFIKPTGYKKHSNKMVIFDTSQCHSVVPTKNEKGSLRIIYSFCREYQTQGIQSSKIFLKHQEEFAKRLKKITFE